MHTREEKLEAFGRLLDIMDNLREKCPWDRKQTFESLRHLTIEETYELADAILDGDLDEIKKKQEIFFFIWFSMENLERKCQEIKEGGI